MWIFCFNDRKINILTTFLFGAICFLFVACIDEESEIQFTSAQTERLLSNDSTKTWKLIDRAHDGSPVALEDCSLENELIFAKESGVTANKLLFDDSCDEDKIFDGYWEVLNQNDLLTTDTLIYLFNPDTLLKTEDTLVVDHDTLINIIENITSRSLTIYRLDIIDRSEVMVTENYEVSGN